MGLQEEVLEGVFRKREWPRTVAEKARFNRVSAFAQRPNTLKKIILFYYFYIAEGQIKGLI